MTHIIRIDPDGTVTELEGDDLLAPASEAFGGLTQVFTCHPITDGPPHFPNFSRPLIGVCHDFAYSVTPICNPKAWTLYGRSPIAGPAFIGYDNGDLDDRPPLEPEWIAKLAASDWLVQGVMNVSHMRDLAEQAGLAWPDLSTGAPTFMTQEHVDNVCRIGQGEATCSYLTLNPMVGYECAKLGPLRTTIDARRAAGTMGSMGDNCPGIPA